MIDIGIDPGMTGAIAAIDQRGAVQIADIPTVPMEWPGMGERRVHLAAVVKVLRGFIPADEPARIWIERVGIQGSGINAIQSVGSLCGCVALLLGACEAVRVKPTGVTAPEWTKHFGLRREKAETQATWKGRHRAAARGLYPAAPITLAKHDGRADALLIAHYGKTVLGG